MVLMSNYNAGTFYSVSTSNGKFVVEKTMQRDPSVKFTGIGDPVGDRYGVEKAFVGLCIENEESYFLYGDSITKIDKDNFACGVQQNGIENTFVFQSGGNEICRVTYAPMAFNADFQEDDRTNDILLSISDWMTNRKMLEGFSTYLEMSEMNKGNKNR